MNLLFVIVGVTFTVALFSNCKGVRHTVSAGEAVERVSTFWSTNNNSDNPNIILPEKAWYQDSIGITQICRIWFNETDTSRTTSIETVGYRLVNLRKNWAYEYATFSDTAPVQRKYRYTDTTLFAGGWNFATPTPLPVDGFIFLADTTVNGILYKRCKVNYSFNQARFEGIGLFRCDIKNTHFQIDTALSNKIGCPLVSFNSYRINNPQSGLNWEIKFISNQFPDSVVKVFTAWKKNENTYPVQ